MRVLGVWLVAGLAVAGAGAWAQSPADAVIAQLSTQGYVSFSVSRTLLGRVQVIAVAADGGRREIVFNPSTGEILRDYVEAPDGSSAPVLLDRADDLPASPEPVEEAENGAGPDSVGAGSNAGRDGGGDAGRGGGAGGGSGNGGGRDDSGGDRGNSGGRGESGGGNGGGGGQGNGGGNNGQGRGEGQGEGRD